MDKWEASSEELKIKIFKSPYWRVQAEMGLLDLRVKNKSWNQAADFIDKQNEMIINFCYNELGKSIGYNREVFLYSKEIMFSIPLRKSFLTYKSYSQLDAHLSSYFWK
jgi:hypothetical protein